MRAPKYSRAALIERFKKALVFAPLRLQYAVGGATALAEHGFKRFTADVDVFVLEAGLNPLMQAFRKVGLEVFAIAEPSHYAAKLPGDPDPERRLDVLVPHSEPELSAVEYPMMGSDDFKVFTPDLLALVKFYAYDDSADVRHAFDLAAMHRRGMFDPALVRGMLVSVDPERAKNYDKLIRMFGAHRRPKSRPTKRIPKSKRRQ